MSANLNILSLLADEEVISVAQGQSELTLALAERLEMLARESEEIERNLNQLENANERSN
jgi:hypothetical protein